MASLLKNQILKHLSKFTKNLSPEKLQMSTMRGSFEVNNIELNEQVLMELLELPVWLSLTKAHCNYASVKINWIKIKTIPIYIVLDEVTIEAETCEDFREVAKFRAANKVNLNQEAGSYGFINKVIDGITLSINSVNVQFRSAIFSASFELTRITIESRSCLWKAVDDLSKTRIRDPARGQVLVFKHIEWQTLRFVAKSETKQSVGQAPLRLIANAASCRLTLKKRLSDSAVLGARIMVIFDDLLWVLTDSQLLSALHFADYLGGLIKRAPRTKTFEGGGGGGGGGTTPEDSQQAKAKLASMGLGVNGSPTRTAARPPPSSPLASSISSLFSQYDFLDTSFHLIVRRIEVHLMDDLGPCSERSQCPELSEGGALQMTFLELFIDLYPYQAVTGSRRHWLRYAEPSTSRAAFINHKLKAFFARQQAAFRREGSNFNLASLQHHLLSRVVVIRLSDYSIGCVSTNGGKSSSSASANKKTSENGEPPKLIAFDHSAPIPANVNPVYIELNNYFYLEPFDRLNLPLPDTNIFAAVAPVRINFEPLTILWINAFFANLRNALVKLQEAFPPPSSAQEVKVNLRAEILMPTVVLDLTGGNGGDTKSSENGDGDADKPQPPPLQYSALEVKISRILIYNCDSNLPADYFRSLEALLKYFSSHADFYLEKTAYPWLSCDMPSVSSQFVHQISRWFAASTAAGSAENINEKFEVDFWTISIEPVWVEFRSALTGACEPLLEPINLTLWAHAPSDSASASANNSSPIDMNVFARIADPVKVQLKHGQLLALLRLLERVGDFTAMLNYDTYMIQRSHYKRDVERSNAVAAAEGFDGVYKQPPQPMCSFDIDEKVVKAIFKSMAIATTVPEVSLFLLLREEEREDELAVPLMLNGLHHHLNEVDGGFQQQQTLTPAASTPDLNTEDTSSGSDSLATEPALGHPGIDGTRATTDPLGGLLVDSGESLEFEKISITSSTATHHHHPLESSGTVAVAPNGIFYTANNTTTTHAHVTLAKPASFHNLSSSSGVTEGDLISLGSATNLARPTNHNQHTSVTASYTRRGTFASNHSFDSASNFRSYLNENDDALSTFSDLSADDSDQASFIAMIQAEEKGGTSANGGDLFFNSPAAAATTELGVEVAEEISENFFDGGGDDTLNGEGVVHQHNQQHQHPPLNRSVVVTPCILPIAAAHQRPKTTYIDLLHVRLENVNIIQQSSKGFLSQIALDTSQLKIEEHQQLTKAQYINLYKAGGGGGGGLDKSGKDEEKEEELQGETDEKQPQLRVTLRIDAFNKGTLRDEMISVRLQHLPLTLQKETIDLVVDFFNDQVAEKAAPTAVLLEGLTLKIIDRSVRMPPVVFTVPRLKLARNKENKWIVEPGGGGDTLAKDSPPYNQLLLHHLKVFERNLLFDVSDLIREQDRLTAVESRLRDATSDEETQALVDQILTQKELLLQEIELLRKANAELMQSCAGAAGRK